MGKISQLEKAIESLKAQRDVIDLALNHLIGQQKQAPKKASKPKDAKAPAIQGFVVPNKAV